MTDSSGGNGGKNYGPGNLTVVEIAHEGCWDAIIEPAFGGEVCEQSDGGNYGR
jgi:hypothetical protein